MRTANAALTGGSLLAGLLVAVSLGTSTTEPVLAQAGTLGSWRTVTTQVPINPVHAALMRNGEVLMVAGSGNVATETNYRATVWDPVTETFDTQPLGTCSATGWSRCMTAASSSTAAISSTTRFSASHGTRSSIR